MPKRLILILSDDQIQELTEISNNSPKPYLGERASAVLKLAKGQTASQTASDGLLRRCYYETVSDWFHRFQTDGIRGLKMKGGTGRKPAFPPLLQPSEAVEQLHHLVAQTPAKFAQLGVRWKLATLRNSVS